MSIYDKWKKSKENNIYERWKKEKQKENEELNKQEILPTASNGYISNKQENKNIWNDLKGIAGNFTRSLGNLGINAYENVNRINGEYINQRNKLLEDTNNKYITKSLKDKGYLEQQIQDLKNNSPTLESVANNSKVLNGITNSANKIIQPMENKFQEWENANNQKIQENIENASNPISKKILELTPSIAQSSVNLIPGGNVLFSAGITQNYYEGAKQQKGMSDEEASKYASIMATLESATELVGARLTKNVGKSLIKGNVKSALVNYGLDIGENFLEEAVMEPLNELTTTAVAGKEKADWENIGQRSLQAGIDGALTSILMGGASAGVGSAVNVVNKISNGQVVTKNEIQTAVKDTQNSGIVNVESILKDEMNNAINKSNLQQNQVNKENNIQTQQTIQEQNIMSQNQTSAQLNNILNNKELPMQSYQYEKSDNAKINNLRQDANKYFNNSEKARNYVNMLEKIITDKNIDIRLDANLKTSDGRIANGSYSNGVIIINPNSTRAGEFIAIHELTHAIGTKEMLNMINTYRNSNTEFDTAVKGLLKNYQGIEITEEALSDISAQLFGNQEFINNIAQNNPNIFQKLYSEIKYLWHQFRGYKNQNQFVEDLYYKWTQAYKNNNQLNNTTNYYIETVADFNEMEYNNSKEIKLPKQEYAILSGIVNSDSNIKPGINYVETTNATYTVYYKDTGEFKILDKEVSEDYYDEPTERIISRTNESGNAKTRLQAHSSTIQERGTGTHNDEISNFNKRRTRISDSSMENDTTNNGNVKYSIQDSENNSELSEEAKKQLHRYVNMNTEELNKAFSDAIDNKENMLEEYNRLSKEYKEFQNTEEFMNELENGDYDSDVWNKAEKYADKLRYYNAQYEKYKAQQEAINSLLMGNETDTRSSEQIVKEAEKHFGITNNFKETAYIDINGNQIDFSGKHEGGMSGSRSLDHRQINEINIDMQSFIDMGNIRIIPEGNGINLSVEPNDKQYAKLSKYIDNVNGEIYIDIDKTSNTYDSAEYKKGTSTSKIISDIQYYFKNGEFPKKSELAQFRYSISKNNQTWQSYLDKNYKATGTRTNLQDIKLPTKNSSKSSIIFPKPQDVYKMNNKEKVELLTDEDYDVLNKIYEKEGKTEILTEKKKADLLEKYANDKYTIKDSLDILSQKFINKGHYIDQLAEKANNLELKFVYDKNLNSFAEGQYVVGVAQTDNQGKEIGKSINEIWEPIENSKLTKEFSEYLLHKHNIDRSERGKYIFGEEIGPAESTSIALELEKKYPEFKQYAEDIKKFNHNNLNNLKEAGMLTQDTIDYIESMYPNYIAISRNLEDSLYIGNNEKTGAIAPLKKATGGNSDIQPIKDTMAQQAIKIKRLVNQNQLGKELAKTLKNAQIDEGVDIELSPTLLLDMDTMVDTDNQGNKYYLYFENGKQLKLKINDNLYESLKPTEISKLEKTLPFKALQKVTSIHRSLLTSSNPIFVVTNFFKDFQDGTFNSKYSSKFIKNYGKALNEIYTEGKYYQSYMANGGMTNTYFDYNEGIKKQNKFVQKIRNINEIVEQLPRLAEFISTLEDGKSLNEALYNAAEITTNFKRGGDITKALNRNGVNFLNASIQGLDKQFRNFSGQNGAKGYVNLLAKATIMSIVPSILNHMLLDDDEDYQDLPQSTKDLYYLFKYDDGKFIRIPKGRVLSIFGAAARRKIETVQGQNDAWEGFGETIINQIAPNNPLEDNILSPIAQVKNNKTWYGGDLVSSRLQKELPENQYDETTDEFSKWLGKQIKVSPKKINYLIDQYSGGVGDILLPMITPQAKQNVLIDKFTTDSVLKNKNVSKFYETLEKQTQIANDSFATDEDQLQLKYLNSISKDMSDLYKQKREIQMSNISNKEKTKKVKEIQLQINKLAEKGLNNYSNVDKTNNSSKIGDEEYYRDYKGNWTAINEEEKQKIGDLSLDTYSDYKQIVYQKTQEKRNTGELTQEQDLKNKDKIQILLDSKYSNKEITAIYENYIKNAKDTQYDIISKSGINIKEYLKYKQQEFESDKKEDGTTTGKTISGSKKKKEYNYVNSMNITYEQKLLLLGMNYTLTNKEQTKLANYVNNMKLTKQEKLDIYEKLEGFTVYKNGRVTW